MKPRKRRPLEDDKLRREAELRIESDDGSLPVPPAGEMERMVHELQVHQVELEMQNEELHRARLEVEFALEKYFDLYDFAPVGYYTLERSGAIVETNLAGAELVGVERSRLIGRHLVEFVAPESREKYEALVARVFSPTAEATAEVILRGHAPGLRHLQLQAAASARAGAELQCRIAAIDITERVDAELEREQLRLRLQKAEKLESIGRLAGGVAHDFNNMLAVILGYAELGLGRLHPEDPLYGDMTEVLAASRRASALTGRLLACASRQAAKPSRLDLNATVEGLLEMLRRLAGEAIEIAWKPGDPVWPVLMDTGQVDQILTDLMVNARDAIAGTGRVTLGTDNVEVREARSGGGPPVGEYVRLSVADDGAGMSEATLGQIFEPFFTTRAFGKGAGLGLAAVYGIVKQNDGFVEVESRPKLGTTVEIYLPRHSPPSPLVPAEVPAFSTELSSKLVLLVEDEPALLAMVTGMLERLGLRSFATASPETALRMAEQELGKVGLLLTDVVMPGMNGRELADRLLALRPGLPVLFMSGYPAEVLAIHDFVGTDVHFLQKPFSIAELSARIADALRSGTDRHE